VFWIGGARLRKLCEHFAKDMHKSGPVCADPTNHAAAAVVAVPCVPCSVFPTLHVVRPGVQTPFPHPLGLIAAHSVQMLLHRCHCNSATPAAATAMDLGTATSSLFHVSLCLPPVSTIQQMSGQGEIE
jgi:hypothetical protein